MARAELEQQLGEHKFLQAYALLQEMQEVDDEESTHLEEQLQEVLGRDHHQEFFQKLLFLVTQDGQHFDNTGSAPPAASEGVKQANNDRSTGTSLAGGVGRARKDDDDGDDNGEEDNDEEEDMDALLSTLKQCMEQEQPEDDFSRSIQRSMQAHLASMRLETGGEALSIRQRDDAPSGVQDGHGGGVEDLHDDQGEDDDDDLDV